MQHSSFAKGVALVASFALSFGSTAAPVFANNKGGDGNTTTPIKHLVVIFGENISFDHYFGAYPKATNPKSHSSKPGRAPQP
jgi:phospholipase C